MCLYIAPQASLIYRAIGKVDLCIIIHGNTLLTLKNATCMSSLIPEILYQSNILTFHTDEKYQ